MFIIEMIFMSITANLGLIAITAIISVSIALAINGEKWAEAIYERHPEWMED